MSEIGNSSISLFALIFILRTSTYYKTYHHNTQETITAKTLYISTYLYSKWYFIYTTPTVAIAQHRGEKSPTAVSRCLLQCRPVTESLIPMTVCSYYYSALQSSIFRTVFNYNYIPINRYCKLFQYVKCSPHLLTPSVRFFFVRS